MDTKTTHLKWKQGKQKTMTTDKYLEGLYNEVNKRFDRGVRYHKYAQDSFDEVNEAISDYIEGTEVADREKIDDVAQGILNEIFGY